jgi:hypothetical protein
MRPGLVLAAALAAAPCLARAAQAYTVSVEHLARSSDVVIRGQVEGSRSFRSEDRLRVYTEYLVRARTVLRGRAPALARVVVPGGIEGNLGQRVDGAPSLARGEELVVFLRREDRDTFSVTALAQGKFSVVGAVARPDLSRFTFVQSSIPPGERRSEEMPVAELERRVRSTR